MTKDLIDLNLCTKRDMKNIKSFDLNTDIFVQDPIRSMLGNFWYIESNYFHKNVLNPGFAELIYNGEDEDNNVEHYILKFKKENFTQELQYENNIEYPQIKYDPKTIIDYFNKYLNYEQKYYEYYTSLEEIILNTQNFHINTNYYKINKHYNYFCPFYEDSMRQLNSYEKLLPNIYDILNLKGNFKNKTVSLTNLSLDTMIPRDLFENILLTEEQTELTKKYFNDFGKAFSDKNGILKIRDMINLDMVESDNIMTPEELLSVDKLIGDKIPFPFYNYLEFSSNKANNDFIEALKKNDLYTQLFFDYYNFTKKEVVPETTSFVLNTPGLFSEDLNIKFIDFKEWLSGQILQQSAGLDSSDVDVISRKYKAELLYNDLKNNVNLKKYKKKFKNMLDYKKSKTFPLFYKIEKVLNEIDGTSLQTYLIPITENKITKFFDTQVKYDKKYIYKVSICMLIVGNEYYYKKIYKNDYEQDKDISNGYLRFDVVNNTSLKIFELPYFSVESQIVEEPFDIPEVEISSYFGVNSKIRLSINKVIEETISDPTYIEDSDFDNFSKVSKFQGLEDNKVKFKNKKGIRKIQIYKTLNKPNSYVDFGGYLSDTVTLENNNTFSYDDRIIPNTTYYYTFRTINEHGIPSNCSKIYKIMLVDEGGICYLTNEIILLNNEMPKNNFKSMRRYLQIFPAINQTVIGNNMEELERYILKNHDAKTIQLGVSLEKVWNKKFKARIRSKSSGKIIEFYFKFKQINN